MHLQSKHFSYFHCRREQQDPVERDGNNILVVRDIATNPHRKMLSRAIVCVISVITVLSVINLKNVTAALMPVLVLLSLDAVMARWSITEINLRDRTIRIRYGVYALAWHRVYSLDDYAAAEIKEKGQLIEGYSLPFFSVYLLGIGRRIKIYSTDDREDAAAVYVAISDFLKVSGLST